MQRDSRREKLRKKSERQLDIHRPDLAAPMAEADLKRIVHELQVHQNELEMQNQELLQA